MNKFGYVRSHVLSLHRLPLHFPFLVMLVRKHLQIRVIATYPKADREGPNGSYFHACVKTSHCSKAIISGLPTIRALRLRYSCFDWTVQPMPSWLASWILFCAGCLALPTCLLWNAWARNRKIIAPLVVPAAAIAVLSLAMVPELRHVLIGGDYTRRLFVTIGIFAALARSTSPA